MKLSRRNLYVFMGRDRYGEYIGVRVWKGRWKTIRILGHYATGAGKWRVIHSDTPFWRRGPRMVLEVPA